MAPSSLASKRHLFSKHIRPVTLPASSSVFSTNAVPLYDSNDRDSGNLRRSDPHILLSFCGSMSDPFSTGSSLSHSPETKYEYMNSPVASGIGQIWKSKQTADGFVVHVDMPGLGKDNVKVSVEQNTLIVKGEEKKESEDDGYHEMGRSYSSRIDLPGKLFKIKEIKAEMKNGVLKVFVPKMKEEERTDVHHVSVE